MAFGFDLEGLIRATGYVGVTSIVYAESGLLVGALLPGDSLLFTAGFLSSQGYLNIWVLCILVFVAAVAGDNTGYAIGRRYGPRVFKHKESLFFRKDYVEKSEKFYKKHGGKTIILARFTPVVRTFAPLLAGVGKMHYRTFFFYNIVGALFWGVGVSLLGYFLGKSIPNIDAYLLPIIIGIIFISLLPTGIHILKDPEHRKRIAHHVKRPIRHLKRGRGNVKIDEKRRKK